MHVGDRIRDYFSNAISEQISDEDDVFERGIVNSLFGLQLVLFVEHEFGIAVERDELDIANFCSIASLTNFVHGKLGRMRKLDHSHGLPTD